MKICKACRVQLPLVSFSPQKRGKYGVTSKCRVCKNTDIRQLYASRLQVERERSKEKHKANPRYSAFRNYWSCRGKATRIDSQRDAMFDFYMKCPLGMEVDHIVPLSKGGTHTLQNIQYLTPYENKSKSNKVEGLIGG